MRTSYISGVGWRSPPDTILPCAPVDGHSWEKYRWWLLGLVHPEGQERTTLAVLDAQDLAATPVAEVHVLRRIPFAFHGNWVAA